MKVATSAYPLDRFQTWGEFEAKLTRWVHDAADNGADMLVFPEYASMELGSLSQTPVNDRETAMRVVSDLIPKVDALHDQLAQAHGVYILAATAPVFEGGRRPVNRARLFGPDGPLGPQDKQIMTMVERAEMDVHPGAPLRDFETPIGRFGVLTCYDVEFPDLGHALMDMGVEVILAPSYTDKDSGYWRVRIGAMARALEGQCVTVHAPCLSDGIACPTMGTATGAAGVFGPPDVGFPENGVIALGEMGNPGWVYADISVEAIHHVRAEGRVRNFAHWAEQSERLAPAKLDAAE